MAKDASLTEKPLAARFSLALGKTFAAIDSGAAREKLSQWIAVTQR